MRAWIAALLRRLVAWAQTLLRRLERPSPMPAVQARGDDGPPPDWSRRASPPPPAHWLERARRAVPLALVPDTVATPAAEAHSQPGAPARPRRSASSPAVPVPARTTPPELRGERPGRPADPAARPEERPPRRSVPTPPPGTVRSPRVVTRVDEPAAARPPGPTSSPPGRRPPKARTPLRPTTRVREPLFPDDLFEEVVGPPRPPASRPGQDARPAAEEDGMSDVPCGCPDDPAAFERPSRPRIGDAASEVPAPPGLPGDHASERTAWPELPGASAEEEPWLDALRETERRRRLDLEQRGWPWSA